MAENKRNENSGKSKITKKALSQSLKTIMEKKSFQSITVSDITNECGLSRLTFYYHFQDKYELLNWICYEEVIGPFEKNLTFENWYKKLEEALIFMKKNKKCYWQILTEDDSELKGYIFKAIVNIINRGLEELSEGKELSEEDKGFIAHFFADGVIGTITRWAEAGMKESPKEATTRIEHLVEDSKALILYRYLTENN